MENDELNNIGETYLGNDKKLLEMLKLWLNAGKNSTWNAIVQVLRKNMEGRNNLANEIEKSAVKLK